MRCFNATAAIGVEPGLHRRRYASLSSAARRFHGHALPVMSENPYRLAREVRGKRVRPVSALARQNRTFDLGRGLAVSCWSASG